MRPQLPLGILAWRLILRDTGMEIDPSPIPSLFTKFATKLELGGTELGLFIAKRAKDPLSVLVYCKKDQTCSQSGTVNKV